jgi:hypothetical protein
MGRIGHGRHTKTNSHGITEHETGIAKREPSIR